MGGGSEGGAGESRVKAGPGRHRLLVVVGAAAAVAAVASIAVMSGGGNDGDPLCQALGGPLDPDEVNDQLVVFAEPEATVVEHAAIRTAIEDEFGDGSWEFVDQEQAYEEFAEIFAEEPAMLAAVSPAVLPSSYRVDVDEPVEEVADSLGAIPGVYRAVPPQTEAYPDVASFLDGVAELERPTDEDQFGYSGLVRIAGSIDLDAVIDDVDDPLASELQTVQDALEGLAAGVGVGQRSIAAIGRVLTTYETSCLGA